MKHLLLIFCFVLTAIPAEAAFFDRGNVFTPQEFGAVCDAEIFSSGVEYDSASKIAKIKYKKADGTAVYREATNADIGKVFGYAGTETTIQSITEDGHLVTADSLNKNNEIAYLFSLGDDGTDDTDNINEAIKYIGFKGTKSDLWTQIKNLMKDRSNGGVLHFPTGNMCAISLPVYDEAAGKTKAIRIQKFIDVPLVMTNIHSTGKRSSGLMPRWGDSNKGFAIGNENNEYINNFSFTNLKISGVGFAKYWYTKPKGCIRIENPHNVPDAHNSINWNDISHCGGDGVFYSGRGENEFIGNTITATKGDALNLTDTYDNKILDNSFAAPNFACLALNKSGSTIVNGNKFFYCGLAGGTDYHKSACVSIKGVQYREGHTYFGVNNWQECRGSAVVIEKAGLLGFGTSVLQGAGRRIGDKNTKPDKIANIHIIGSEAYQIDFDKAYINQFPLWGSDGWGNLDAFVIIDGDYATGTGSDGIERTRGARDININVLYPKDHVAANFDSDFGVGLDKTADGDTVQLCMGDGCTNGLNPNINFNGADLQ